MFVTWVAVLVELLRTRGKVSKMVGGIDAGLIRIGFWRFIKSSSR